MKSSPFSHVRCEETVHWIETVVPEFRYGLFVKGKRYNEPFPREETNMCQLWYKE